MCGIIGFVGQIYDKPTLQEYTTKSCLKLRQRGPDQRRVFIDHGIALGATRLAIQDLELGLQPMSYQGFTIVFNGEIYNKQSIKNRLQTYGYVFQTDSDTEVLLKALVEFGESIIQEIEGMFAFGLWDKYSRTLILARDRWGEKPLYYTFDQESLTFASEIKAFDPWPHVLWDVEREDLRVFLKNSYLPHPRTGWKHIHKLEQGSFLKFQNGDIKISRYFTPSFQNVNTDAQPQELYNLLKYSVKSCLIADRPIGAFLSGGLDSTTIAYFLSREDSNAPIFSLHWKESSHSEEQFTSEAAKALGLNHFSIECTSDYFRTHFDSIVDLYDEPFGDESMVPTYCLAQFAKEKVDVVLTGDGADEFFHGYERYFFEGSLDEYLETFSATSSNVMELIGCNHNIFPMKSYKIEDPRNRSWIDINSYLTDDILMKVDRACMGVSLESRCPFLTPPVTNFALGCPIRLLIGNRQKGKEILREAMENHLPRTILERKKMGFGVPLNEWFRGPLKEWMVSRLLEGDLYKLDMISKEGVLKLISLHDSHQGNYSRPLLNLLVLERWIKRWILIPSFQENQLHENFNYRL
ncbi:MAG: asparagine synthase (glutamine-hydrolyzing) [Rhabdochlamydiaceae bacterium]|nr:asparagine synthase (glutamine-hydrolyzing) [Rhabdochlamydiaceae bacterium]